MNGDPFETPSVDQPRETAEAGGMGLASIAPPPPPPPAPVVVPTAPTMTAPTMTAPTMIVPTMIVPTMIVPPKPKPVIVAERVEDGWRTEHVLVDRDDDEKGYYVTIIPSNRPPHVIYVAPAALDAMIELAVSGADPGKLWKAVCDIPLERPLPSRVLEEEFRVLLTTFANELRHRW